MSSLSVVVAASVLVLLSVFVKYFSCRTPLRPPGPRGLPLLGNVFDLPSSYDWIHWATFKDKYGECFPRTVYTQPALRRTWTALAGPVSSVTVLGKTIVILNTLRACTDLLEKRSSIYSGRPVLPFAGEM